MPDGLTIILLYGFSHLAGGSVVQAEELPLNLVSGRNTAVSRTAPASVERQCHDGGHTTVVSPVRHN